MPLYEYQCKHCTETYDEYRAISERDSKGPCPKCGSKDTARAVASLLKGAACSVSGAGGGFT
ncbi:MAG: FmdB family transcriptional regulator [Armatimonadetes bacterium CG_4_10_14_3_um_filter_66_18]|nr:zinc ribbon domain-containing protein [Armatimonadota bacterium]OIP10730.1 MAG: hypothetical protein AUJ96_03335 [Armatimonadetes bacterium CG2_30_66_41]PIU94799.1 MAG: FmdB family transcriptional regulator [Armatimonadetes bacterium CG06_land_8_20_14_3_00_66_21]PIX36745.1 MAG: FmdB family transcriptional regulator [Armatimonadetes bacterium CG_4_8_14_3_um_filter_66_20]PIY39165.1 MAG: FmdB family transcriptional regulator [Armatimonadetes bacterium CG_4_10_14_3_um_filter_66_18]PIZ41159.1 MA